MFELNAYEIHLAKINRKSWKEPEVSDFRGPSKTLQEMKLPGTEAHIVIHKNSVDELCSALRAYSERISGLEAELLTLKG